MSSFPNKPEKQDSIDQERMIDSGYYINIFSTDADNLILDKIRKISRPLSEYARPCSGYNPYEVGSGEAPGGGPHTKETVKNKPYHSSTKKDSSWKPEIIGRNLRRFHIDLNGGRWVKYGPWLSAPRSPENFKGKRILVQEITGGKEKRIVAAYCEKELYHSRDVIPVKLDKSALSPYYLLALINSRLLSWYHRKCNPKAQKGLFPKVLVSDLKKLPIIAADKVQILVISDICKTILERKTVNPDADTALLERDIDCKVYAAYGLNKDEITIIEAPIS